jgi:hypothetical protein
MIKLSNSIKFIISDERVFSSKFLLELLFEVEAALVLFCVTMLATEHITAFTREPEKTNFPCAGPAKSLVYLYNHN